MAAKKSNKTPDRRKRKKGNATLTPRNFKGKSPQAGHEDRLAAYIKRTITLKQQGYSLMEIAESIAQEFDLPVVPHIATVARWRQEGWDAVNSDIRELQMQLRIDQFNELEKLKGKWMPLATAEALAINRWVRVEGELQPELDENAIKEQIEATKQCVAIMNRQARLLGLDIEKSLGESGDGPQSLQELQLWMIGQVNIMTGSPNGTAIDLPSGDVQTERLELRAGVPEMDDDSV